MQGKSNSGHPHHSSDSQDLMLFKDGFDQKTKVDKCYCEKVAGLAK